MSYIILIPYFMISLFLMYAFLPSLYGEGDLSAYLFFILCAVFWPITIFYVAISFVFEIFMDSW